MEIQLIRNATMKIKYAGKTILTDPMLSSKGTFRSFAGIEKNPTIELPFQLSEILDGIDCVIVSHTHPDHFDDTAIEVIEKNLNIFCQPIDKELILEKGFSNVIPIENNYNWNGITITRTGGKHGKGKILERMGQVSGFVLQAKNNPTIYWIGDSILTDEVTDTIKKFNPDIIITHSGGATLPGYDPIIMDDEQTLDTINAVPNSKVIAIHMESLDHCTVTRESLREKAKKIGISDSRLLIPDDGEKLLL